MIQKEYATTSIEPITNIIKIIVMTWIDKRKRKHEEKF